MFKRFSCSCLLLGWLCASGALLDTIQVYAWARMFIGYTRTMSLAEAGIQTMDPDKPCPICLAVRRAREAEQRKQPAVPPTSVVKTLLVQVQNEPLILPVVRPEWPDAKLATMASWHPPVPVPPPRTPIRRLVG